MNKTFSEDYMQLIHLSGKKSGDICSLLLEDFKEKFSKPSLMVSMASNDVGHFSYILMLRRVS